MKKKRGIASVIELLSQLPHAQLHHRLQLKVSFFWFSLVLFFSCLPAVMVFVGFILDLFKCNIHVSLIKSQSQTFIFICGEEINFFITPMRKEQKYVQTV